MNKKLPLLVGLFFCAGFTRAQSTTTQPNGVVVHQAQGVEGNAKPEATVSPVRTIDDWNLSECIDAEIYASMKLNEAITDSDKKYYGEQLAIIKKRKSELIYGKSEPKTTK